MVTKIDNVDLVEQASLKLHSFFATDQNYYAEQHDDGNYTKKAGKVSPIVIKKNIDSCGSMAIYQKNTDLSIKWICYDFDILKKNIEGINFEPAKKELIEGVILFTHSLCDLGIPYLVEHSGNRGFHVWIVLSENISYAVGYDILQAILNEISLDYDKNLIGIDLFPKTKLATQGVGSAVKIPISKHKKSGFYSWLLNCDDQIRSFDRVESISANFLQRQIDIMENYSPVSTADIEEKLGISFDLSEYSALPITRIKLIKVHKSGFTLDELLSHWEKHPPLDYLRRRISIDRSLNNEERKLIVGLFCNIRAKDYPDFSINALHSIFECTKNYNHKKTEQAIKALSSFNFPSQSQIENITGLKFDGELAVSDLLARSIPNFLSYEDATFDMSSFDINITRAAELNYVFQNDEAQSRLIINELSGGSADDLLSRVQSLTETPDAPKFHKHNRNEGEKTRELISFHTPERLLTSCIMKQLIYLFDMIPSAFSHGYKPKKGFQGGYIFEPWLYLWIKFLSNIGTAIGDESNKNYYIVKTDIRKFYDSVPHDNLKRLLLGGVNERIDSGLVRLNSDTRTKYNKLVDVLFSITKGVMGSNRGLPQGPAYARYFAEIYLDNIDAKFEEKINSGEVILYERYVDDIFFIVRSEHEAKTALNELELDVKLLGLDISQKKTVISRIGGFSGEFNNYRSQSKYAVDTISRDFEGSTKTQKNLAVNEFMKLVQSDSCNEDLSFIFSHLSGVSVLDAKKREMVIPTMLRSEGRGSLYKNLYNFVFDDVNNWDLLRKIEKFNELQSEVFLSSAISHLDCSEVDISPFIRFIEETIEKLTITNFVREHLAFLHLRYGADIEKSLLEPKTLIKCMVSFPGDLDLVISQALISHINTELNNIKALPDFIEAIYPLCASAETSKSDLNDLAQTYYAKISSDFQKNIFSGSSWREIKSPLVAEKFYYLLCLFSLSCKNESVELLKEVWKFCTHLFNEHDIDPVSNYTANWASKIDDIEIHDGKAMVVITSIVDGNIFRGLEDRKNIFERFHSVVLVFLTIGKLLQGDELNITLKNIRGKSEFYRWLIDPQMVSYFPKSKLWFEDNVIKNGAVLLRREHKILIRKPSDEFSTPPPIQNEDNGYSEIVVEYQPSRFSSLRNAVKGLNFKQRLDILLAEISLSENGGQLPNIFCNENILTKGSLTPFDDELKSSRHLIYEGNDGIIESRPNDLKGFISYFFKTQSGCEHDQDTLRVNEKYIAKLSIDLDLFHFIRNLSSQLNEIYGIEDDFFYDVAMAATLYLSLSNFDPIQRIERFVDQYHRFNKDNDDRHAYCVNSSLILDDSNPIKILESVEISLRLLTSEVTPALSFYLADDIRNYREVLQEIIRLNSGDLGLLTLDLFSRAYPRISNIDDSVVIDSIEFKFKNSFLINPVSKSLQQLESKHAVLVDSAEHIYYCTCKDSLYLISIQNSISKIFLAVRERFSTLEKDIDDSKSYPNVRPCYTGVESLIGFDDAVNNISVHRDIVTEKAKDILIKWLIAMPKIFHRAMINLIAAHVVMKRSDISNFLTVVEECLNDQSRNAFLIKGLGDYGGAQRLIYKNDDNLGRRINKLEPKFIQDEAEQATIIVDNIISGSQVINAIRHYTSAKGQGTNYFVYSQEDTKLLAARLKKIRVLHLCTVLYVNNAVERIQVACRDLLNDHVVVHVISGRDIGDDATFETTEKIGATDKLAIKELLADKENMRRLYSCLDHNLPLKNIKGFTDQTIGKSNLVARYQSLPKKCFEFLHCGTRLNRSINPFIIVPESHD
jgi:Reverse transcriptase (RNA-dependent DNA polymerase)/TOTE conflict system, Archaeo-Eukaryotic Primase domain